MTPLVNRIYSIKFEGKVSKHSKASGLFLGSCQTSIEEVGCDQGADNTVSTLNTSNNAKTVPNFFLNFT